MKEHLSLLGQKARDRVTGFKGVVTSVTFDLYGCIQGLISPGLAKDNKIQDSHWFDLNRIEITDKKRVLPLPEFAKEKGGNALPLPRKI